jgi:hypothetical protein
MSRADLETLVQRIADRVDATPPAERERLLVKALMLLADRHGDVDAAIRSLEEAAQCGGVPGRGRKP